MPLSDPLQTGVRFLRPPIPARPSVDPHGPLSTSLWERSGLPRFACVPFQKGLGSASPPAVRHLRGTNIGSPDLTAHLFGPCLVSLFGMFSVTTAQQRFTWVSPALQPQLPTALRLAVATAPRGLVARHVDGGYRVPDASHPGVAPGARPGRVPVAEHRIFDFPDK